MAEQHSSEAKLVRCIISKNGLEGRALGSDMLAAFDVFESIESPFMAGSLTISDSKNFINDYPIEGGETIQMELKSTFSDIPINNIIRIVILYILLLLFGRINFCYENFFY